MAPTAPTVKGPGPSPGANSPGSARKHRRRLTLAELATHKRLPVDFLRGLGVDDLGGGGVAIPYYDAAGNELAVKRRTALKASEGSYWPAGMPLEAYGQNHLGD